MNHTEQDRAEFEQWYTMHAHDYAKNPIGSRDCDLQWRAWQASRADLLASRAATYTFDEIKTAWDEAYCEWPDWFEFLARLGAKPQADVFKEMGLPDVPPCPEIPHD